MGQLKTNEYTEELISEVQSIWEKLGDPDMTRVTTVNCALLKYRDELKVTFAAQLKVSK